MLAVPLEAPCHLVYRFRARGLSTMPIFHAGIIALKKKLEGAGELAQPVKAHAAKPEDLGRSSEIHMIEKEN